MYSNSAQAIHTTNIYPLVLQGKQICIMSEPEALRRDLSFLKELFYSIILITFLRRYRLITVILYLR